ncbi:MAG TPA: YggT family protein [Candidatus Omnitrophota bacterium]|nr:YggT family protein [Candidatus Omnitrophota bacterium]HPT06975.1 YggT family protein [Candidatus Omnitrophota bacterium]
MFILANFITAFAGIVNVVLTALYWLVLIRALLSWVNPDPFNPLVQFLNAVTEPILYPIRKLLPFSLKMSIDISPVIAFLLILFLQSFLVQTLHELAMRLKT